jgi:hypothetical protein
MLPSFNKNYDYFRTAIFELGVQTIWAHAIPGAAVDVRNSFGGNIGSTSN